VHRLRIPGERLERARAVLHRATQNLGERQQGRRRAESVPGAGVLAVAPALAGLFPEGGPRRGGTIRVPSSLSLVISLLAEPSARGIWTAVVGLRISGRSSGADRVVGRRAKLDVGASVPASSKYCATLQ
jgi:hypothetical protein